jgi:hypothetical protein
MLVMNKKTAGIFACGLIAITLGLGIHYLLHDKISQAELSEREINFYNEIFIQKDFIDGLGIHGDVLLYVRGEIKGKSFEGKYTPEIDFFGNAFCGSLPTDILYKIKINHPNISSPQYLIKFFNFNKELRWISINTWVSEDEVFISVGKSGKRSGASRCNYRLIKINGLWTCEFIGITIS